MVSKKLTKRDIEGFLSCFVYNAYGGTDLEKIPMIVFSEENFVSKKLNHRVRANPPPPEVNGDLDLYEVSENEVHSSGVENVLR